MLPPRRIRLEPRTAMNTPSPASTDARTILPTTVGFIGYHAIQRPNNVAVIQNGQEISYAKLYGDIGRTVAVLRDYELNPGGSAAVECPQFYLNWVL